MPPTGWIAAAGVDVLKREPPEASSPLLQYEYDQADSIKHQIEQAQSKRKTLEAALAKRRQQVRPDKPEAGDTDNQEGQAQQLLTLITECIQINLFFSHLSRERGHALVMQKLNVRPILDLDMRLGEGTGAALAMSVIEASMKIYNEMATFSSAGVSEGQ